MPLTHLGGHDGEEPAPESQEQPETLAFSTALASPRIGELLGIVKALSASSTSGPSTIQSERVARLLVQSGLPDQDSDELTTKSQYESEIEWLLVGKATVQTYGILMNTLLDQIIPLSDDIWYWDEVLSSYSYSSMYMMQTSPLRMWDWSKDIYRESIDRFQRLGQNELRAGTVGGENRRLTLSSVLHSSGSELSKQWRQFYSIVKDSIAERSVTDIRRRLFSRVDVCRVEARRKRSRLIKLREMTATGLGILMDEGLNFGSTTTEEDVEGTSNSQTEWRGVLERSIALMDMILQGTLSLDVNISDYEDRIFAGVEEDPELSLSIHAEDYHVAERPSVLARRLLGILQMGLPDHVNAMATITSESGRPSRLVRYWIPAVALVVSSSTILRILVNRKDDILNWIRNLGATAHDFWFNWVVEPTRKIIGTIRHDANSEIAIMSRDSLKADRESLERMVVDFALDKPDVAVGNSSITDAQVAEIRAKVREGDVTPVLRAYERDLRRPFVGAVSGDLVRSLLIQVQKTKVDLEVAISGIDALLKSQELVFGFVGLTPGVLGKSSSNCYCVFPDVNVIAGSY